MAEKQELEITISENGEVGINVLGAKGKNCMDMTKDLEDALGLVTNREMKSSYYEQEDDNRIRRQTGDVQ
ncbi:DUF2997 domain-containing protein [Treponema lecithinolyticum]|uniref:DUF2997 domain-containing protein n=1 Tax=Treponema lecithinolyticum TaxID=53418 RepID=UPI0028E58801|nr:DUF2997 domain-containing protein [Treponema lecithinolyticum]